MNALWRSLMLNLFINLGQNSALELPRTYKMSRAFIQVGLRNDGNIHSAPLPWISSANDQTFVSVVKLDVKVNIVPSPHLPWKSQNPRKRRYCCSLDSNSSSVHECCTNKSEISFKQRGKRFHFYANYCPISKHAHRRHSSQVHEISITSCELFAQKPLFGLRLTRLTDLVVEFWTLGGEKTRKPQRETDCEGAPEQHTLTDNHKSGVEKPGESHWLCRLKLIMTG